MRSFVPIDIEREALGRELDELETFLASYRDERAEIAPFFKARPNLSASLALTSGAVAHADRWAAELDLFGDFVCDVACGDSEADAYTLVEFEDAQQHSIFRPLERGKSVKRWSPRFEHGVSQLVDWAWRMSTEGTSSPAYRRVFGANDCTVHLLLVIGREADLGPDDVARMRWRANNVAFGAFRMSCFTFDGVLHSIRRRLMLASQ